MEARRQRIDVSQSLSAQSNGIPLQGVCALIAIAIVHSDNRLTCAIAQTLFATGIAISVLMIAAYTRPFTGEISVGPDFCSRSSPVSLRLNAAFSDASSLVRTERVTKISFRILSRSHPSNDQQQGHFRRQSGGRALISVISFVAFDASFPRIV
jgi:hypothetical protein